MESFCEEGEPARWSYEEKSAERASRWLDWELNLPGFNEPCATVRVGVISYLEDMVATVLEASFGGDAGRRRLLSLWSCNWLRLPLRPTVQISHDTCGDQASRVACAAS